MLAFLESLCSALKSREALAITELLRHPLASALPATLVEEAQKLVDSPQLESSAFVQALRFYHQTAHLLGACSDPATRRRSLIAPRTAGAVSERPRQMELELPFRAAVA